MSVDIKNLRELAREEAARWTSRMRTDELFTEEAHFREWLEANEENQMAWRDVTASWSSFDAPTGHEDTIGQARLAASQYLVRRRNLLRLRWPAIGIAIAATLALFLLMPEGILRNGPNTPTGSYQIAAEQGGQDFTLADGSHVHLALGSSATVAFTDTSRTVALNAGSGEFSVAHNAERPFSVAAAGHMITALGTEFRVSLTPDGADILLHRGRLRVSGEDGVRYMESGDGLSVAAGMAGNKAPAANVAIDTTEQRTTFSATPLSEAIEVVNRHSQMKITIANSSVGQMRISGTFTVGDARRFADAVALVHPVRIHTISAKEIRIEPR